MEVPTNRDSQNTELKIISNRKELTSNKSVLKGCSDYLYGFNGMEKDDEVKGAGNSYTATNWQYDSRLGRRWNIDPIYKHNSSNYLTFGDNPVNYIDPSGADWYRVNGSSKVVWIDTQGQDIEGFTYLGEFRYSTNWSTDYNKYGEKYNRYIYFNFLGRGTKGTDILKDVVMIGAGVVTIATFGAASPFLAGFAVVSGSFSIAGGTAKLTLDLANAHEIAEKVPDGYLNAIIGVSVEYMVDGEKYKEEVSVLNSALNVTEGILTMDLESLPKNALEATDLIVTGVTVANSASDIYNKATDIDPKLEPYTPDTNTSKKEKEKIYKF